MEQHDVEAIIDKVKELKAEAKFMLDNTVIYSDRVEVRKAVLNLYKHDNPTCEDVDKMVTELRDRCSWVSDVDRFERGARVFCMVNDIQSCLTKLADENKEFTKKLDDIFIANNV